MLALTVYGVEVALCTCGARALTEVVLRPTPAASKATIANILHELEIFISSPRIVKNTVYDRNIPFQKAMGKCSGPKIATVDGFHMTSPLIRKLGSR